MSSHSYSRAPHVEGQPRLHGHSDAPNAALLIDFDNVTMGMRSDLSKELKNLLNSDIIRGKVTVQRAYADWRRYPQYIVPLSEASIDLIFAPAYGSSKKNATDIRMAIDGMELVFIRPEIGTYILLTGDSDFSSLVLKLKEYGKYVIGVGIQESSSDILVQNCDEYYSYTSLTGLRRTSDTESAAAADPWVLVEKALAQMDKRNDVMRSDRLKQVMLELDPGFDEGSFGFSKFSRFLSDASSRGLVRLKRMENGQYEVSPTGKGSEAAVARKAPEARPEREARKDGPREERARSGSRGRRGGRDGNGTARGGAGEPSEVPVESTPGEGSGVERTPDPSGSGAPVGAVSDGNGVIGGSLAPLTGAYELLRKALQELGGGPGEEGARDSDVKRKMLALDRSFDEAEYGFSKFSRFLRQAHDHEVVDLKKTEDGNYQVSVRAGSGQSVVGDEASTPAPKVGRGRGRGSSRGRATEIAGSDSDTAADPKRPPSSSEASVGPSAGASSPASATPVGPSEGRKLNPRVSSRRTRSGKDEPPPLFEGQIVGPTARAAGQAPADASAKGGAEGAASESPTVVEPVELKLPTDPEAMVQYLSNSYGGVGRKTAETLVEAFGQDLFSVLQDEPERVRDTIPAARAEKVIEGWEADFARRQGSVDDADTSGAGPSPSGRSRGRGRRTRGGSRG